MLTVVRAEKNSAFVDIMKSVTDKFIFIVSGYRARMICQFKCSFRPWLQGFTCRVVAQSDYGVSID